MGTQMPQRWPKETSRAFFTSSCGGLSEIGERAGCLLRMNLGSAFIILKPNSIHWSRDTVNRPAHKNSESKNVRGSDSHCFLRHRWRSVSRFPSSWEIYNSNSWLLLFKNKLTERVLETGAPRKAVKRCPASIYTRMPLHIGLWRLNRNWLNRASSVLIIVLIRTRTQESVP